MVERAPVPSIGGEGDVQRMAPMPPVEGKFNYEGEDTGGKVRGVVHEFRA